MTEQLNTIAERIIERNKALGIEESEEIIRKAKEELLELLAA